MTATKNNCRVEHPFTRNVMFEEKLVENPVISFALISFVH